MTAAAPDVVSSGEPRPRSRLLVGALLLLALSGVAVDRVVADRSRASLAEAVADGELQVRSSSASLGGLAQYLSSPLTRADATPGARGAAYDALGRDAARHLPDLDEQGRRVRSITVLPWEDGLRDARDAYAVRLQAWVDALREVQRDPTTFGTARPDVAQALDRARLLLREVGVVLPATGEAGVPVAR